MAYADVELALFTLQERPKPSQSSYLCHRESEEDAEVENTEEDSRKHGRRDGMGSTLLEDVRLRPEGV